MASIETRAGKGTALTHDEMDKNLKHLDSKAGNWNPDYLYVQDTMTVHLGLLYRANVDNQNKAPHLNPSQWTLYSAPHTHGFADISAAVLDQDDFASDSAVHVPTQQSTKAYVEAAILSGSVNYEGVADFLGMDALEDSDTIAWTYDDVNYLISAQIILDPVGALEFTGDGVKVKANSITHTHIAATPSIGFSRLMYNANIDGLEFRPENVVSLSGGGSIGTSMHLSDLFSVPLTSNGTLSNPTNMRPGTVAWIVKQDATGGRTLGYGSSFTFFGDPDINPVALSTSIVTCLCDGTALYCTVTK